MQSVGTKGVNYGSCDQDFKRAVGVSPIATKVVTYECEDDRLNATLADDPEPEETQATA